MGLMMLEVVIVKVISTWEKQEVGLERYLRIQLAQVNDLLDLREKEIGRITQSSSVYNYFSDKEVMQHLQNVLGWCEDKSGE